MRTRRLVVLAAAAWLAGPARAAFEDLGAGARAPGMGNAFTGLADDEYAIYYNPAGLAQLDRPQLSAAYSKLYTGLSDGSDLGLSQFTYAHPLKDGRNGTVGAAFQSFALNSIYSERTLYLSYGRQLRSWGDGSRLLGGLNVKYLSHSFSPGPEAGNACDLGNCSLGLGADPLLSGNHSKSVPDADFGLLYRFPRRFQVGLMIEHALRPDVGFGGGDKLAMNYRAGLSYKSLWMSLTGELKMDAAPDGSRDKDFIFGAERYFPSLDYGQFGLRGSLGFGSRSWRELTVGLSYRINKIQFDYGFLMPLGGIGGTAGTHRIGMTFHFGAPTAEDEITKGLLEKARQAEKGHNDYGYEFEQSMRPHDLSDPKFEEVRRLIEEGHFHAANERFLELTKDMTMDDSLQRLAKRLELASYHYPDLPNPQEKWEVQLSTGLKLFLYGRDRMSMLHTSYARDLNKANVKLDQFLAKLEEAVQIRAQRLPADSPRGFIEDMLYRVEAAHNARDINKVKMLLRDLQELEPGNVIAMERVGSMYFVLGQYPQAVDAWQRAMALETRPAEIESLKEYMRQAHERMGQKTVPLPAAPGLSPAAPETAQPPAEAETPPERPEPPQRAGAPAAKAGGDPRDISNLYQKGVEHYARGEYLQAMAMFMRILQIDPENAQARKALDRIQQRNPRLRSAYPNPTQ